MCEGSLYVFLPPTKSSLKSRKFSNWLESINSDTSSIAEIDHQFRFEFWFQNRNCPITGASPTSGGIPYYLVWVFFIFTQYYPFFTNINTNSTGHCAIVLCMKKYLVLIWYLTLDHKTVCYHSLTTTLCMQLEQIFMHNPGAQWPEELVLIDFLKLDDKFSIIVNLSLRRRACMPKWMESCRNRGVKII